MLTAESVVDGLNARGYVADIMEELYIAPEFVQHLKELPADAAFVAEVGASTTAPAVVVGRG